VEATNIKLNELIGIMTQMEIVDLTHVLEEGIPAWPTHARYFHNLVESYKLGDVACHYQLVLSEHTGTHIDAPLHFIAQGPAHYGIDQVPVSTLQGRAATITATDIGENRVLTRQHVENWEAENGELQPGDIILIRFGWDKLWKKRPDATAFLKDWPGVGEDAAQYFVDRKVKIVGTDAMAIDAFADSKNPAHYTLLGNEVLIVENLNNLDQLPPFSYFMAFPLKIKDGSGSPIRAIAYFPK
jgi:kynurenine formamidase